MWSLPLWSKQYSWQVLGAIKEDHPRLDPNICHESKYGHTKQDHLLLETQPA